jgi:signal transduction histidine kinase
MLKRISLHARLMLIAVVTSIAALLFAFFAIGDVLEGFVIRGAREKLDTQIMILAKAVQPDGRLDASQTVELPGMGDPRRGWGWRVITPAGTWSGGSGIRVEKLRPPREDRRHGSGIQSGRGRSQNGQPVFIRRLRVVNPSGPVEITAAAPRRIILRPLRAAMTPLLFSLALLGAGLGLAAWLQLRYGLRPVRDLRADVAKVRAGEADRLPQDQPRELQPLVDEVNGLIEQNAAGLAHARRHLSNLAHGLKTPLATLSLKLDREGASAEVRALVDQLDQRIAHHLSRARSAASGARSNIRTPVAEVAGDLIRVIGMIHAERALTFDTAIDPSLAVAVERQDLEELLGNLIENAGRHARSRVSISAASQNAMIRIQVEDDGDGMTEEEAALARHPGARLDESGIGYGFGLAIAQELAELYGGSLELVRSETLGGLSSQVIVPGGAVQEPNRS